MQSLVRGGSCHVLWEKFETSLPLSLRYFGKAWEVRQWYKMNHDKKVVEKVDKTKRHSWGDTIGVGPHGYLTCSWVENSHAAVTAFTCVATASSFQQEAETETWFLVNTQNQISYRKSILQHFLKIILDWFLHYSSLALNQWAKPGFNTEPVQIPCLHVRWRLVTTRLLLKNLFLRTIHYTVPVLSWSLWCYLTQCCFFKLITPGLSRCKCMKSICHLSLCFLPCDIIYNNLFLWSPIKPPYFQISWPVSRTYLIEMLIPSCLKPEIALEVFNQTNGWILLVCEYLRV